MKRIVIIVFLAGCCGQLFAQETQETKISGTVTSKVDGTPISGLGIYLKEYPERGVITDTNGRYSLQCPKESTLIFSCIGFDYREIKVDMQPVINVALEESKKMLGELIVIDIRNMGDESEGLVSKAGSGEVLNLMDPELP